ncbi:MAG: LytTR family transcriptional regulator [Oscillospiraceae bacterium]|nr:LytTR family transcriptional regulator [Oscillospiraceae bacterium]
MKHLKIVFEQDARLPHIEVCIRSAERDEQVEYLIDKIAAFDTDVLLITDVSNVTHTIPSDTIIRLTVSGKQLNICTESDTYTVSRTLQYMEQILDPARFIRISRHEIVNLQKVQRFDFSLSGTLCLKFLDGTETWASRRCISAIRKRISGKE